MIVVVDNTMLGKRVDLRRAIVLGFDLEQFPVTGICGRIHSVHPLDGFFDVSYEVVSLSVFDTCFGYELELRNIVTSQNRVFHGRIVQEVFLATIQALLLILNAPALAMPLTR